MRIFKGLENIHAVIDRHDNEWRREQGEPEIPEYTPNEAARRRWEKTLRNGKGKLDADRFLNKAKKEADPEELGNESNDPEVEIVEVIKQEGVQHSWLYNEVEKAVKAAVAGDKKHTKVIAIFVPVIQNAKEFEELPADDSVTLPPVEEEIPQEDDTMPFDITVDETLEEAPQPSDGFSEVVEMSVETETPEEEEAAVFPVDDASEPALGDVYEEKPEQEEQEEHHDFNLLPEGQEHPDEELAQAFNTMEEKLEESLAETSALEAEPESDFNVSEGEAENSEIAAESTEDDTLTEEISEPTELSEGDQLDESFRGSENDELDTDVAAADSSEFESDFATETEDIDENIGDSDFNEEFSEEVNEPVAEVENPAEELTVIDETPDLNESETSGEAMSFEEFPVIKENEAEAPDANLDEFIEEVTDDNIDLPDENENIPDEAVKKTLEPPTIEDFEDEEIFEEPLEMLDENSGIESELDYEYSEYSDDNKDIRIE